MKQANRTVTSIRDFASAKRLTKAVFSILALSVTLAPATAWSQQASGQAQESDPREAKVTTIPVGMGGASQNTQAECRSLPVYKEVTQALKSVVAPGDSQANGGLGNHMWATIVDRTGAICLVTRSGEKPGDQWPGSRGISATKAFTANAFSLPGFALSTANLYWPSQPGKSLYGLEPSSLANAGAVHVGPADSWGGENDPLVDKRLGGVTVFAGGLALYNAEGELLGGLGLSGDESCTDHVIAWKLRHRLNLDNVPAGVTKAKTDNIIYDIAEDPASGRQKSASGYGHPMCSPRAKTLAEKFPDTHPTGPEK